MYSAALAHYYYTNLTMSTVLPSSKSGNNLLVWVPDGLPNKIQVATDMYGTIYGYKYGSCKPLIQIFSHPVLLPKP